MKARILMVTAATAVLMAFGAQAAPVTDSNPQGWAPANVRANGAVAITDSYKPDASHTGSLEFTTNTVVPTQDKADYANYSIAGAGYTLGSLINGGDLGFDYFIDSITNTDIAKVTPVLRLAYLTTGGESGLLVWESVYNDGASQAAGTGDFAQDTWISKDILDDNFWMRAYGPGRTIEAYNFSLAEWAAGASFGTSHLLGLDTKIIGVEVGVGSGWGGNFKGAVDNVNVDFGNGGIVANFEVSAVPEPGTWALMITGFGLAGAALRRRSKAALAA